MPVAFHQVLAVADDLVRQGTSEATLRAAVSRYFYGIHTLVADMYGTSPGKKISKDSARKSLRQNLTEEIAGDYWELYQLRLAADYDPSGLDEGKRDWVAAAENGRRRVENIRTALLGIQSQAD